MYRLIDNIAGEMFESSDWNSIICEASDRLEDYKDAKIIRTDYNTLVIER